MGKVVHTEWEVIEGFAAYGAAVSIEWHSWDFLESLWYGAT